MRKVTASRGFTLIEVLIVLTLVVILGSVRMAPDTNSTPRAREAVLKENLFRMRDAIGQYYADKNKYPAS
jgi:general secretion pathway protein G